MTQLLVPKLCVSKKLGGWGCGLEEAPKILLSHSPCIQQLLNSDASSCSSKMFFSCLHQILKGKKYYCTYWYDKEWSNAYFLKIHLWSVLKVEFYLLICNLLCQFEFGCYWIYWTLHFRWVQFYSDFFKPTWDLKWRCIGNRKLHSEKSDHAI